MKKGLFLIVLLSFLVFQTDAYSQIRIGAKGGANFSQIIDDDSSMEFSDLKIGYHFGGIFEMTIVPTLMSLQFELLYTQKGDRYEDDYITLNYVEVPVNAKLNVPVIPIYVSAGPYLGYLNSIYAGDGEVEVEFEYSDLDMRRIDFGYNVSLGYVKSFAVLRFFTEARFNHGIINLNTADNGSDFNNLNFSVSAGILIGL